MTLFRFNPLSIISLKCTLMNNQKCKIGSDTSVELVFYAYSITISKCKVSCNTIKDSYAKLCVPDIIKNITIEVFNLMSRTNA